MSKPAKRPLLAIGHSHLGCVQDAAVACGLEMEAINFWLSPGASIPAEGTLRLSDELRTIVRKHRGPVLSFVGGSSHTVLGVLVHPRRFDFVLAEQPGLPIHPEAELLPQHAVAAMLRAHMRGYLDLMEEIAGIASEPIHHFESPPPYWNGVQMRRFIPWALFPDMKREISAAPFRWKMWRLHSALIRDWCEHIGADFTPCPERSFDERGFLAEACFQDGLHGNRAYGRLVVEQIGRLA
ncbi:MAG: hypothetical protein AB7P20_00750 [Rhizobiaceae bacterium]